jgi:nicotinamide-nucleotide amidase
MHPLPIRSAELLAVGTELLLGEIVDTNSAWLAQQLADRSVDVYWSQRVGDNRGRIADAVRQAVARSDLVVVCGGLGPTDDDVTREALADVAGEEPRIDAALEAELRERFARFSRTMPARNLKQAWLIPSAEALPNPVGTAPGWLLRLPRPGGGDAVVVALPGPPAEMMPMWLDRVRPRLAFPTARFVATTFKTFGIGESHAAELLGDWTQRANPSVATYAKRDGVHVRVAAKADDDAAARALLAPAAAAVAEALGERVWGTDGDELAERALAAVSARNGSLAVIDLATGGRLAALLSDARPSDGEGAADAERAGSLRSGPLRGAVVAWRDEALDVLGVPYAVRDAVATDPLGAGKTDDEVDDAAVLARAACARFATDHGVALTPWRVRAADGMARPSWTACWAVVGPTGTEARRVIFPPQGAGARDERLAFSTLFALWSLTKT